jgi:hypothetical protein
MKRYLPLFFVLTVHATPLFAAPQETQPVKTSSVAAKNEQNEASLHFAHPNLGFSLDFPASFEQVATQVSGVGLALRSRSFQPAPSDSKLFATGGFPTITVTVHPGALERTRSLQTYADEVLSNYRKIGLIDATVLKTSQVAVGKSGTTAPQVVLTYSNGGTAYVSAVTLITAETHHYITTYLDTKEAFEKGASALDVVLTSFQGGVVTPPQQKKRYPQRDRLFMLFTGLVAMFALVTLALYQSRRKAP